MNRDAKPLGPAFAWQDDNGSWRYATDATHAPADAVQVERLDADGQIVLSQTTTGGGQFIWDAERAD